MNSLYVKNLRSLRETPPLNIKPITIILGANSTGKSSFIRTLPMLRQSTDAPKTSPFLLYGHLVDFGTYNDICSRKAEGEDVTIGVSFNVKTNDTASGVYTYTDHLIDRAFLSDFRLGIELSINGDRLTGQAHPSKVKLVLGEDTIEVIFKDNGDVVKLTINDLDLTRLGMDLCLNSLDGIIPLLGFKEKEVASPDDINLMMRAGAPAEVYVKHIIKILRPYFSEGTKAEVLDKFTSNLLHGSKERMFSALKLWAQKNNKTLLELVNGWSANDVGFEKFRNLLIASSLFRIMSVCDHYLVEQLKGVTYIAPLRATAERYYRAQDLAVEEVDPQGKNLAMFLQSLNKHELAEFSCWLGDCLGFSISSKFESGHISLFCKKPGGKEYNIADVGFGISQVLPIATQLWSQVLRRGSRFHYRRKSRIIVIEQPELHLHPSLQAKLAELFVSISKGALAAKLPASLIIETHSETIVNKIGTMIADGALSAEDATVVVFEKHDEEETTTRECSYESDGALSNWPYGFFSA